jgi:hypothetical protein
MGLNNQTKSRIINRLKESGGLILFVTFNLILVGLLIPIQLPTFELSHNVHAQGPASGQNETDLAIDSSVISISDSMPQQGENITITAIVHNIGNFQADAIVNFYIYEKNQEDPYIKMIGTDSVLVPANGNINSFANWSVDAPAGLYELRAVVENLTTSDPDPLNNIGSVDLQIESSLQLISEKSLAEPGDLINLTVHIYNNLQVATDITLNFYFDELLPANLQNQTTLTLSPTSVTSTSLDFIVDENATIDEYYNIIVEVTSSTQTGLYVLNANSQIEIKIVPEPDTSEEPVLSQLWFIIGLIALILFFVTIIASLIGLIPQDRLPIQPALIVMAFVITVIALIGHAISPRILLIGPQDLAGMIIIHPITALTAGFLVAGALEAAGAFTAAIDALGRLEKLKFKGFTVFGIGGTVVILTNIPTIIAMPCGRILAAALMPAALFFGYRVAKSLGDARMVGVVVFPFIVNAAASCGPSPLGGIGTIGEGMAGLPIGSFTTAQSTGIMMATGVCAMIMRFVTPLKPSDLSDEDLQQEKAKTDVEMMIEENKRKSEEIVAQPTPKDVSKPVPPPAAQPVQVKSQPPQPKLKNGGEKPG